MTTIEAAAEDLRDAEQILELCRASLELNLHVPSADEPEPSGS